MRDGEWMGYTIEVSCLLFFVFFVLFLYQFEAI